MLRRVSIIFPLLENLSSVLLLLLLLSALVPLFVAQITSLFVEKTPSPVAQIMGVVVDPTKG